MSENQFPDQPQQNQDPAQGWGQQPPAGPPPGAPYASPGWQSAPPVDAGQMHQWQGGPLGKVRSNGTCVLLFIVTCGIYGIVYYYMTHDEMKRHSNQGLGGVIALILAIFVGIVNPFLLSNEVGNLRASRGQEPKVSGMTGLWYFPGMFILVGPFIWFFKTNDALNEYWISQGAQPA
ncbi:DUF4234 domain-containing protein [Nocardioides sp. AE5]|uniref:DUF4234 domain-containing protein n=1 Tax=Nocardioides sp. AE5 TaxID=2962573 RepID=UPI00288182AD|nr:DUF4234 domain-containing protein [Nocardioides sp. AE5]MDT0202047.1 DUF4234 domain-containing protein [Nocardioides sp. AE5]